MYIKSAAILYEGKIYEGKSHAEIGVEMVMKRICKPPYPGGDAQGFVTSEGNFVSRTEALKIAIEAGQVIEGHTTHTTRLFSEDIRKPLTPTE